jgi:hypothetical protein
MLLKMDIVCDAQSGCNEIHAIAKADSGIAGKYGRGRGDW